MEILLTPEETRVLGCLVEKAVTTPEYYPLSLNAVRNACNQKSGRDPVVAYDDATVQAALDGLRDKHLLWVVSPAEARVPKYQHRFPEALDLSPPEVAILSLLMLRGPQTPGELRGRSERLYRFSGLEEVEAVLRGLAERPGGPLAVRLPRQPGRKEHRYAHALEGIPAEEPGSEAPPAFETQPLRVTHRLAEQEEALSVLREELQRLREELAELRSEFEAFRQEFQ
ncbi:MAG: YceH family protein [Acidobacteriota bacterium]